LTNCCTLWQLNPYLRESLQQKLGYVDGDAPIGGPGKVVEADETFIGGL